MGPEPGEGTSKQKGVDSMSEVDLESLRELEAVRARIQELSARRYAASKKMENLAKSMRLAALEMDDVFVLLKDDLYLVEDRIDEILDEELAAAGREMGTGPAAPRVEDRDYTCCASAPNGTRCNRPVVAAVRYGDGGGNVCPGHKSAYERTITRITAEFGDGIWGVIPFDCSLDIHDEPALPDAPPNAVRRALDLAAEQPDDPED
jgi:hypothetical protein